MITTNLPSPREMYRALVARDPGYEGVFCVGVRTTGIFCRPTCPARKPRFENVEFFARPAEALASGYRPCKRCRPLEPAGAPPAWLRPLLAAVEADPQRRRNDAELQALGVDPVRARRWFQAAHGMTFHGYLRARRLGRAFALIREGADQLDTAYAAGYESLSGFREAFANLFGTTPGRSDRARVLHLRRLLTPLGPMLAGAVDEGICLLEFADRRMLETQLKILGRRLGVRPALCANGHLENLAHELAEYFAGARTVFTVPLVMPGTEFQQQVWRRLLAIPCGTTLSYAELAADIGRPGARRAVGTANGANRLAVVVPCHRVIRSDGSLSGYGGGLWRKQALLDHEAGRLVAAARPDSA